jgi:hypothetical protein
VRADEVTTAAHHAGRRRPHGTHTRRRGRGALTSLPTTTAASTARRPARPGRRHRRLRAGAHVARARTGPASSRTRAAAAADRRQGPRAGDGRGPLRPHDRRARQGHRVGHNGTTSAVAVPTGTHTIGELAAGPRPGRLHERDRLSATGRPTAAPSRLRPPVGSP